MFSLEDKSNNLIPLLLQSASASVTRNACCTTTPWPRFDFPLARSNFSDANLLGVRKQPESGNLLAHLWRAQRRIWQPAACPVAGSLVAVTQEPGERHPLRGRHKGGWSTGIPH